MADAVSLARSPDEKISAFNKRLLEACQQSPVTDVQLIVVDGQPVVTLFSEVVEATEEDVEEAKADGDTDIKVGDTIPENPPISVQVARVACATPEAATKTHSHLETLYQRANGEVVKQIHATGSRFGFSETPDKKGTVWVEQVDTYVAVAYLNADAEDQEDEAGEGAQE